MDDLYLTTPVLENVQFIVQERQHNSSLIIENVVDHMGCGRSISDYTRNNFATWSQAYLAEREEHFNMCDYIPRLARVTYFTILKISLFFP